MHPIPRIQLSVRSSVPGCEEYKFLIRTNIQIFLNPKSDAKEYSNIFVSKNNTNEYPNIFVANK